MISVCIPAYENAASFIRTLRTVLSQKNCDFEVIVSDDSRSDVIEKAIMPYISDPRIHYFKNEARLGPVNNWNYALSLGTGSIKKLLHHDDWFDSEYSLIQLVTPILDGNADIVFCSCKAMTNAGMSFTHTIPEEVFEMLTTSPERLVFGNLIGGPSVSAVSAKLQVEFDPKYLWMSDVDYYIRLLQVPGVMVSVLDKLLVCISTDLDSQISRVFERDKHLGLKELFSLASREYSGKDCARADMEYLANSMVGLSRKKALHWLLESLLHKKYFEARFLTQYLFKKSR